MEIIRRNKLIEVIGAKKIIVFGDLHGDYESFSKVKNYLNKNNLIIFLGDYADRGNYGVEILEELSNLLNNYDNIIALKGNHEDYSNNGLPNFSPCDLINEVNLKRGSWKIYFENFLKNFFKSLPIAVISEKILFVHGGISSKIKSRKDLENPNSEIEKDVFWSDPFDGIGEYPNPRGLGVLFGKNITNEICKRLNVEKIIRSHEPQKALNSPFHEHANKVITISSTRVYGGKPFVLIIEKNNFFTIYI